MAMNAAVMLKVVHMLLLLKKMVMVKSSVAG